MPTELAPPYEITALDVCAHRYYEAQSADRGDEKLLHVSDLTKCPREVAGRLLGKPRIPFTDQTRRKFAQGFKMEQELLESAGWELQRQGFVLHSGVEIGLWFAGTGPLLGGIRQGTGGMPSEREEEGYGHFWVRDAHGDRYVQPLPLTQVIYGHVDRWFTHPDGRQLVVETKSETFRLTNFSPRKYELPAAARPGHMLQVAAYAIGVGNAPLVAVYYGCRASGLTAEFRFLTETLRAAVQARAEVLFEMRRFLHLGMPVCTPPQFTRQPDGGSWMYKFCRLPRRLNGQPGCPHNENEDALVLPI